MKGEESKTNRRGIEEEGKGDVLVRKEEGEEIFRGKRWACSLSIVRFEA